LAIYGSLTAIVVGLPMIAVVVASSLTGVMLPFLLTRLHSDPAVASSPLITSIANIVGLMIYFPIATRILGTWG